MKNCIIIFFFASLYNNNIYSQNPNESLNKIDSLQINSVLEKFSFESNSIFEIKTLKKYNGFSESDSCNFCYNLRLETEVMGFNTLIDLFVEQENIFISKNDFLILKLKNNEYSEALDAVSVKFKFIKQLKSIKKIVVEEREYYFYVLFFDKIHKERFSAGFVPVVTLNTNFYADLLIYSDQDDEQIDYYNNNIDASRYRIHFALITDLPPPNKLNRRYIYLFDPETYELVAEFSKCRFSKW